MKKGKGLDADFHTRSELLARQQGISELENYEKEYLKSMFYVHIDNMETTITDWDFKRRQQLKLSDLIIDRDSVIVDIVTTEEVLDKLTCVVC